MIKILNTGQIRKADQYTIEREPVASIDLMERAARAFVTQFLSDFPDKAIPKYIFCGNGNNGGDGMAIARILLQAGHQVTVCIFPSTKASPDCSTNLKRLLPKYKKQVQYIESAALVDTIPDAAIILDAIFGTGLNQPVKKGSLHYQVIEKINAATFAAIIAVDIPSGLFADEPTDGIVLAATQTYTFQFPKLAFLLPESGKYAGNLSILDIGLHRDFIARAKTNLYYTTAEDIRRKIKPRKKYAHKGNYGHALIVAGSYGKMGAAVLSATACLRAGAGLVTAHIPACGYEIVQETIPEAMCDTDKTRRYITQLPDGEKYDAIAMGPGIGTQPATARALEAFLKNNNTPLVIDADGINLLAGKKKLLRLLPAGTILTPHPKEFERIAGTWKNDMERLHLQQEFSRKYKVILVLKGAHTGISDTEGNVYFNSTGNAGMATAGSGDVLTGIITGLLAQQYSPLDSALAGVYLHGLSGDLSLKEQSKESLIASDIIAHLGNAFNTLQHQNIG